MSFKISVISRFIVLFIIIFGSIAYGQEPNPDVNKEIVVQFRPSVLKLPNGRSQSTIPELSSIDSKVRNLLLVHQVDRIRKAFPNFNPTDSIRVTLDGRIVKLNFANVYVIRLPQSSNRDALLKKLKETSGIVYAEPNMMVELRGSFFPKDTYFDNQWNMFQPNDKDIDATDAWDRYTGSSNEIIGLVDGGAVNHDEFNGYSGRVFGDLTGDSHIHATHVLGIAAAEGDNQIGIAGMNWQTKINIQKLGDLSQTANAIRAAVDAGASVINNSWGQAPNSPFSITLARAFAYAFKSNVLSSVAMPENSSTSDYPNKYDDYIGGIANVIATTKADQRASYALLKNYVDFAAPGGDNNNGIYTTNVDDPETTTGYGYFSGTSLAAPHVTGLASLMEGYSTVNLENDDIENILKLTAEKVGGYTYDSNGWSIELGYGRINANDALTRLDPSQYSLEHKSAYGSTVHSIDQRIITTYDINGLQDGASYEAYQYDVRKTITFPAGQEVNVWGRGLTAYGWTDKDTLFGNGFCEVVPGSQTSTSAVLRTYIYLVHTSGEWEWFPAWPEVTIFRYSILRKLGSSKNTASTSSSSNNDVIMSQIPDQYELRQNYPNPFNPETEILYALPKSGHVKLIITNLLGQSIRELIAKNQSVGWYNINWDGRNDQGIIMPSGIYLYRISIKADDRSEEFTQVRKMSLLR